MPKLEFTRYPSKIPELEKVQDQIEEIVRVLNSIPFLDGVLTQLQFIDNSQDHAVPHSLGHAPQGVFVIENTAATAVNRLHPAVNSTTASRDQSREVLVKAAADTNVKLWVF
jgi:hypothetical protein